MHSSAFRSILHKTGDEYFYDFKDGQKAFLDDFSSKHMMTKEMWSERLDLSGDYQHVVRAIYQFYYSSYHCDNDISKRKIYNWKWRYTRITTTEDDEEEESHYEYAVEDFCYPQIELESKLERFNKFTCSFVPKPDTVEKLKQMYSNIRAAEGDDKKWFKALMAFGDHEFIFHNVEYRLGGDLTNRSLWLMYIEYLKTHDSKKLLQTYSKFIRFFLDDVKVIAEYREAVKKYGPVLVPWKNLQDFETFDENFFQKEKAFQSYKRTWYERIPPVLIQFNPETEASQNGTPSLRRAHSKPPSPRMMRRTGSAYFKKSAPSKLCDRKFKSSKQTDLFCVEQPVAALAAESKISPPDAVAVRDKKQMEKQTGEKQVSNPQPSRRQSSSKNNKSIRSDRRSRR